MIAHHPDTGSLLQELHIPHWEQVLGLATRCFEVTDLGYLGADIVLDQHAGPLILELNARPGLAIQVANGEGLKSRTDHIDDRIRESRGRENPFERAAFSRAQFSRLVDSEQQP